MSKAPILGAQSRFVVITDFKAQHSNRFLFAHGLRFVESAPTTVLYEKDRELVFRLLPVPNETRCLFADEHGWAFDPVAITILCREGKLKQPD